MTWGAFAVLWVAPVAMTAVIVAAIFMGLSLPDGIVILVVGVPIFVALAAWQWYRALTTARQILVRPQGTIEIVTGLTHVEILPADIVSVRPERSQLGFLVIRHNHGRVRLLNQFTDFHRFLWELRLANPGVELVGC